MTKIEFTSDKIDILNRITDVDCVLWALEELIESIHGDLEIYETNTNNDNNDIEIYTMSYLIISFCDGNLVDEEFYSSFSDAETKFEELEEKYTESEYKEVEVRFLSEITTKYIIPKIDAIRALAEGQFSFSDFEDYDFEPQNNLEAIYIKENEQQENYKY